MGLRDSLRKDSIEVVESEHFTSTGIRSFLKSVALIKSILMKREINVMHVNGFNQLLVAWFARKLSRKNDIALVMMVHSIRHGTRYEGMVCVTGSLLINRLCDMAMPVSRWLCERMIRSGLDARKALVVHNAVDIEEFDRDAAIENLEDIALIETSWFQGRTVVYLAQLNRIKEIGTLIRAAPHVLNAFPQTTFLVFGEGSERKKLQSLIKKLGISDRFKLPGRVDRRYVPAILRNCDVAVVTSRSETFGHNIVEPMVGRKPVVATNVGVATEAIKDGITGFLVPVGDYKKMAERIIELLSDREISEEIGNKARGVAEKMFGPDIIAKKMEEAYFQAVIRRKIAG